MKLLILSDSNEILHSLHQINSTYSFGNIQVDFIDLSSNKIEHIGEKLRLIRYHLILIISQAKFIGKFVTTDNLVNTVNNYQLVDDLLLNVVNRTTVYFNIYLEIPKAVSLTTNNYSTMEINELKRIDIISTYNYPIAKLCFENKANYYILNYRKSFPVDDILELLRKME